MINKDEFPENDVIDRNSLKTDKNNQGFQTLKDDKIKEICNKSKNSDESYKEENDNSIACRNCISACEIQSSAFGTLETAYLDCKSNLFFLS